MIRLVNSKLSLLACEIISFDEPNFREKASKNIFKAALASKIGQKNLT